MPYQLDMVGKFRHSFQCNLLRFSNRGVPKDEKEAFRLLELVTDSVGLVSVPNKGIVHADHIPLALYEVSYRVTLLHYSFMFTCHIFRLV